MSSSTGSNGEVRGPLPFDPMTYGIISAFCAIAWYNVIEINAQVFLTFKRRRGLYFWSLLITSWGIAIYVVSFILKFFVPSANWILYTTLLTIGWYPMVTGQSIVLYSRLHLVVRDPRILRFVLTMIIVDACLFHIPTTVMTYGVNSPDASDWTRRFNIMERLQMTAFMIQEFIISGIYVWATLRLLKPIYNVRTRKVMYHLIYINLIIIAMDVVLLVMEYTNYYDIQASLKPMVYSVKLKLEFAVLNQLMVLANTGLPEGQARGNAYNFADKKNIGIGGGGGGYGSGVKPHVSHDDADYKPSHLSPHAEKHHAGALGSGNNHIVKTQDVSVDSEIKGSSPPGYGMDSMSNASTIAGGSGPDHESADGDGAWPRGTGRKITVRSKFARPSGGDVAGKKSPTGSDAALNPRFQQGGERNLDGLNGGRPSRTDSPDPSESSVEDYHKIGESGDSTKARNVMGLAVTSAPKQRVTGDDAKRQDSSGSDPWGKNVGYVRPNTADDKKEGASMTKPSAMFDGGSRETYEARAWGSGGGNSSSSNPRKTTSRDGPVATRPSVEEFAADKARDARGS